MEATIWHNPRCRKSRETLQLLQDRGVDLKIVEYLKTPPDASEIKSTLQLLELEPAELMRKGEKIYKELALASVDDADQLIAAMAAHPILIERPVVITEKGAAIGRPPENVMRLF